MARPNERVPSHRIGLAVGSVHPAVIEDAGDALVPWWDKARDDAGETPAVPGRPDAQSGDDATPAAKKAS